MLKVLNSAKKWSMNQLTPANARAFCKQTAEYAALLAIYNLSIHTISYGECRYEQAHPSDFFSRSRICVFLSSSLNDTSISLGKAAIGLTLSKAVLNKIIKPLTIDAYSSIQRNCSYIKRNFF